MSIIASNRKRSNMSAAAHDYVNASISAALREVSKADLREQLAEAVRNTAKIQTSEGGK